MLISGKWLLCDDDIIRPIVEGLVSVNDGSALLVEFLVDTGADRTAFSGRILSVLGLPTVPAPEQLGGVGGEAQTVLVNTQIALFREDSSKITFRGHFAGFTDPDALDMSVLGRDITNLFALIVDRPQDCVCLLGQNHQYVVRGN